MVKYLKTIIFVSIVILLILVFNLIPERKTTFVFINNETNEALRGEIFFDNYSFGYLENGNISVSSLENIPSTLRLLGDENGEKYEVEYFFPSGYMSYEFIPFVLTSNQINFYKRYYFQKQDDYFAKVLEPHFKKIPITWKIEDPKQCWKSEEDKIRKAFLEIEKSSEEYIKFQEVYSNPDIIILCYTDFTEKYNEYKQELGNKTQCHNISFDTKKTAVSDEEIGVSYSEYKVSAKAISQETNRTIWEVCKVDKSVLSFDPEIIFDPNLKLDDYLIGEGGPTETVGNIILMGEARFFGDNKVIVSCTSGFPLPEVHEILHVLGFSHIIEENELPKDIFGFPKNSPEHISDILYPYKICLNQTTINSHYSSCLKYIYSNGVVGDCSGTRFMFE
jgi:hypothetical protein